MVDGIGVGEIVNSQREDKDGGENIPYSHDFLSADLVVVLKNPVVKSSVKGSHPRFSVHGIYGKILVSSTVPGDNIKDINKKIVWANQKPYILNGDLMT